MAPLPAPGRDHGDVRGFGQLDEGLFRIRLRHAAAGEYQGKAGLHDDAGGLSKLFLARHDS